MDADNSVDTASQNDDAMLTLYGQFAAIEPSYIYFEEVNVDPRHYGDENIALCDRLDQIAFAMADFSAVTDAGLRAKADVACRMIRMGDLEETIPYFCVSHPPTGRS
jgi:hypothetical protein